MEDKMITIPYLNYLVMMDDIAEYKAIKKEMRYLLKNANYKEYKNDLDFSMEINEFLKKFNEDYDEVFKNKKSEYKKENK